MAGAGAPTQREWARRMAGLRRAHPRTDDEILAAAIAISTHPTEARTPTEILHARNDPGTMARISQRCLANADRRQKMLWGGRILQPWAHAPASIVRKNLLRIHQHPHGMRKLNLATLRAIAARAEDLRQVQSQTRRIAIERALRALHGHIEAREHRSEVDDEIRRRERQRKGVRMRG